MTTMLELDLYRKLSHIARSKMMEERHPKFGELLSLVADAVLGLGQPDVAKTMYQIDAVFLNAYRVRAEELARDAALDASWGAPVHQKELRRKELEALAAEAVQQAWDKLPSSGEPVNAHQLKPGLTADYSGIPVGDIIWSKGSDGVLTATTADGVILGFARPVGNKGWWYLTTSRPSEDRYYLRTEADRASALRELLRRDARLQELDRIMGARTDWIVTTQEWDTWVSARGPYQVQPDSDGYEVRRRVEEKPNNRTYKSLGRLSQVDLEERFAQPGTVAWRDQLLAWADSKIEAEAQAAKERPVEVDDLQAVSARLKVAEEIIGVHSREIQELRQSIVALAQIQARCEYSSTLDIAELLLALRAGLKETP